MKTVLRWSWAYLVLLGMLTGFGYYNQQQKTVLYALEDAEQALRVQKTDLTVQKYALISPLSLREWATESGYIPMSLGNWQGASVKRGVVEGNRSQQ
jgi:hypothetical protein